MFKPNCGVCPLLAFSPRGVKDYFDGVGFFLFNRLKTNGDDLLGKLIATRSRTHVANLNRRNVRPEDVNPYEMSQWTRLFVSRNIRGEREREHLQ
jgi:hypothetical protein